MIFPTIRKKMIGENLKALICGSAPLNVDTQLYFNMLGIPVCRSTVSPRPPRSAPWTILTTSSPGE